MLKLEPWYSQIITCQIVIVKVKSEVISPVNLNIIIKFEVIYLFVCKTNSSCENISPKVEIFNIYSQYRL